MNTAMKKTMLSAAILSASMGTSAGGFSAVINSNDSGVGSLRHALETKQASVVYILPSIRTIHLESTLNYDESKSLRLIGSGQTLSLAKNETLLSINEGADLHVSNLRLEGKPGAYDISNRADLDGEVAGKGIFVDVRDDQTGTVNVSLRNVHVEGFANHGVHISDCSLADKCGSGSGGGGEGSPASVGVRMINSSIADVGNGKFDADGLRVNDRGDGDIYFYSRNSTFTKVGADGVELDEGNGGSIFVDVIRTEFTDNGGYCDPALLGAYESDGEYDEGEIQASEIPTLPTGTLDDTCFEREVSLYDDGSVEEYEIVLDLDDGIDLDEAGEGSLYAFMAGSTIAGNLDEGVDFDEEGPGSIDSAFIRTVAKDNNDDGFKLSEEDEGDVSVIVSRSKSLDNGGEGFTLEEADNGDLDAIVVRTTSTGNKKKDKDQFEAVQEDEGHGTLQVLKSNIAGYTLDGVDKR